MHATQTPVVIYGREVVPQVGTIVQPEEWPLSSRLIASDWDQAEFRLPTAYSMGANGKPIQLAVNIVVTGRTVQKRQGDYWVRCRIEFVGDGEPSEFCGGWIHWNSVTGQN